jgi:hypothetical protein
MRCCALANRETKKKKNKKCEQLIAAPHDWATVILCTNTKNSFHVDELKQKEFYDFKKLLKITFVKRVKDENGRVETAKMQIVKI